MILTVVALIGLDVPEQLLEDAVTGAVALFALAVWVWGQIDRKDLKWGIFRK